MRLNIREVVRSNLPPGMPDVIIDMLAERILAGDAQVIMMTADGPLPAEISPDGTIHIEGINDLADKVLEGTFDSFEIYADGQKPVVDLLGHLADRLVSYTPQLVADENPFSEGKILCVHGEPGVGKTHVLNAVVNKIKAVDPRILSRVLYTTDLERYMQCPRCGRDCKLCIPQVYPIIFGDDLYKANSDVTDVGQLSEQDVERFQVFANSVYEHNRFVIITANFPVVGPMFERIRRLDMAGRDASRLAGLAASSLDLELPGRDFRLELSKRRHGDEGSTEFTI